MSKENSNYDELGNYDLKYNTLSVNVKIAEIVINSIRNTVGESSYASFLFHLKYSVGINIEDPEQIIGKPEDFEKALLDLVGFGAGTIFNKINTNLLKEFLLDKEQFKKPLFSLGVFTNIINLIKQNINNIIS